MGGNANNAFAGDGGLNLSIDPNQNNQHVYSLNDDIGSVRSGATNKEQLKQQLNIELPPEESHLFLTEVIGLKDTCGSKFKHILCAIFFNIFYLFYWAWWPEHWYPFRYADVDNLDDAEYVLVTDKQQRQTLCKVEYARPLAQFERDMGIEDHIDYNRSDFRFDKMFMYRNRRYIYNPTNDMFELLHCPKYYPGEVLEQRRRGYGLHDLDLIDNATLYGRNVLKIAAPGWITLLIEEALKPFFCFQVYSVIVWFCEQYYMFAPIIGVMAIASVIMTVYDTKVNFARLQALATHEDLIYVVRNGEKNLVNADQLVLGDLVILSEGRVPCDAVILAGSAVLSEASLTGESLPIRKTKLDFAVASKRINVVNDKCTIYGGTTVLQLKPEPKAKENLNDQNNPFDGEVLAMVTKVGYYTTNGNLISSILFPAESNFEFTRQTYRYLLVIGCMALVGFAWTLWRYSIEHAKKSLMALRSLDLLTIVVPPSLPLAMSTAISFAVANLQKYKIFCINSSVIPVGGKVKICGFDKTGTLTTDTLLVRGVFSHLSSLSHAIHAYQVRLHSDEYHQGVTPTQVEYQPTPNVSTPFLQHEIGSSSSSSPHHSGQLQPSSSTLTHSESINNSGEVYDDMDDDDDDDDDVLDIPEPALVHPEIVHSHCLPLVIREAISVCHALAYDDSETLHDPQVQAARNDLYIDMSLPYPSNDNKAVLAAYEQRELQRKAFVSHVVGDPLEIAAFDSINATFTENSYPNSLFSVTLLPYRPVDQQLCRHSHTHIPVHDHSIDSIVAPCTCYHSLANTQTDSTPPNKNNETWIVLRQFAFDAALQRMAVVALHIPTKTLKVFVKGAPEVLFDMSSTIYDDSKKYINEYVLSNVQQLHSQPLTLDDCSYTKMCIDKIVPPGYIESNQQHYHHNHNSLISSPSSLSRKTSSSTSTSPQQKSLQQYQQQQQQQALSPSDKSFVLTSKKDLDYLSTLTTQEEREHFILFAEHRRKVDEYSRCGFRVIALATKDITIQDLLRTKRSILNTTAQHELNRLVNPTRTTQEMSIAEILQTVNNIFNQFEIPDIRKTCEAQLSFLGLLVLENQLKPATKPTIQQLMTHGLRTVMITGDNIRTACSVAKECGIVSPGTSLFASEIRVKNKYKNLPPNDLRDVTTTTHEVVWRNVDNPRITLDPKTFQVIAPDKVTIDFDRYELAISGPALTLIASAYNEALASASTTSTTSSLLPPSTPSTPSTPYYEDDSISTPTTTQHGGIIPTSPYARSAAYNYDTNSQTGTTRSKKRQAGMKDSTAAASTSIPFGQLDSLDDVSPLQRIALSSVVFARVNPTQKSIIVTEWNKLGLVSFFSGDGANDSIALKAASLSISLADTEASIAAPLTSQITDISSCVTTLCEGRSALASAFLLFRYMALYSFIQFFAVILLYWFSANFCDLQYAAQDLIAVLPISLVMARTHAAKSLTLKRPSGNLLGLPNLAGIFTHMFCSGILQWLLFAMTPWTVISPNYSRPPNPDHICKLHEATSLTYFTLFSYVYFAIVLSMGPNARKWKRSIFTNWLFLLVACLSIIYSVSCLLFGPSKMWFLYPSSTDQAVDDPLKLTIIVWAIIGVIAALIVENIIIPSIRYCSKLRIAKYRTHTVFGPGNNQFGPSRLNAKPYHAIRAEFESHWGRNNVKRTRAPIPKSR